MNERHRSPREPLLLTEKETSKITGFSIRTHQKWRIEGRGPKFMRISSRAIRYRRQDIEQWIESQQLRSSTSDSDDARG